MNPLTTAVLVGIVLLALVIFLSTRTTSPKNAKPSGAPSSVARHRNRSDPPSKVGVMSGGLQHMALADLLQFLAQGGHTGSLQITSGRRSGTIRLVQGLVIHAEFRREQDLEALFELLSLQIGDFHFRFESPPTEPVRGREVVDILMLWLNAKD